MTGGNDLRLRPELVTAILAHARAELPNEACGLLAGSTASGRATSFHPARNADASSRRYSLDPDDLVRITFAIERAGHDLLAIVHSHPRTGAEPSATDRRAARLYPGTPQLIVSLAVSRGGSAAAPIRAWRIGTDRLEELAVRIG